MPAAPVRVVPVAAALTVLLRVLLDVEVEVWPVVCEPLPLPLAAVMTLARCVEVCVEVWLPRVGKSEVSVGEVEAEVLLAAAAVVKAVSAARRVRVGNFILDGKSGRKGMEDGKNERSGQVVSCVCS